MMRLTLIIFAMGSWLRRGFSVMEIMCALAVGVIVIVAAIQASFGEQTSITSSALSAGISELASSIVNEQQALARFDFNTVTSTSTSGEFTTSILAQMESDLVTKHVTVQVSLTSHPIISTRYSTLVTNLENIDAPDTCDATVVGDWEHPHMDSFSIRDLLATSSGAFTVSDVDVYQHLLYIAIESTTFKTDPTLLVVDVSDPASPSLLGTLDNASTTSGLTALRVAEDRAAHKRYVFGANAGNFVKGQLQIIDVTDGAHPGFPFTYKIATSHVPSAGNGKSIYYKDGYVYLGLSTAPGVVEFNIVDVHNKTNPVWKGGYTIGNTVESILIKGDKAYLVTDDSARELAVLDVSDVAVPAMYGTYNAAGATGSGFGRSIAVVGSTGYLGRTWSLSGGIPEFYMLDILHPVITSSAARDVGTSSTNALGVYGVYARSNLGFLLTKSNTGGQLQIIDIGSPGHIANEPVIATLNLPSGFAGTAMDCEQNTFYLGSANGAGEGMLSIVTPG